MWCMVAKLEQQICVNSETYIFLLIIYTWIHFLRSRSTFFYLVCADLVRNKARYFYQTFMDRHLKNWTEMCGTGSTTTTTMSTITKLFQLENTSAILGHYVWENRQLPYKIWNNGGTLLKQHDTEPCKMHSKESKNKQANM